MNKWVTGKGTKIELVYFGPSSVYRVSNGKDAFLVDAATLGAAREVADAVKMAGEPTPFLLVLTHTHFDHAGAAYLLKGEFGLKIAVHRHDAGFLATGLSPFPAGTTLGTKAFMALVKRPGELVTRYPGVEADILVDEEYSLAGHGFDARIVHTPGHTEGCVSVIVDDEIAIVGDTLYGLAKKSIVSPLVDDKDKLFESVCALCDSGCGLFLPGHGPAITRDRLKEQIDDLVRRRRLKAQRKSRQASEE